MKRITSSGDEALIQKAREKARGEDTTLNTLFQGWLARYVGQSGGQKQHHSLMNGLSCVNPGCRLNREEMNSRWNPQRGLISTAPR